jgi:signal transduction histidine kinase
MPPASERKVTRLSGIAILALALIFVFALFRWVAIQEAQQIELSVKSVLRDEYSTASSFQISRSLSDLESLRILQCATLTEQSKIPRVFYDTSIDPHCTRPFLISGLRQQSVTLKAMNGLSYRLQFEIPYRWQRIILELLSYLMLCALFFIFNVQKNAQRMREQILFQSSLQLKELAEQVVHDIRSPLETLEAAVRASEFSTEHFELIRNSTKRIRLVINDLVSSDDQFVYEIRLQGLLNEILKEKRFQFRNEPAVRIEGSFSKDFELAKSLIDVGKFHRVLSNLINNAQEASREGAHISVSCKIQSGLAVIEIRDRGCGIEPEILEVLGRRGVTSRSKPSGGSHGLGFFFSKKCVEAWGGRIEVSSTVGIGTAVTFFLPCSLSPGANLEAVLLDDDEDIHVAWKFAAKRAGKSLKCYSSERDLFAEISTLSKSCELFVDLNLRSGSRSGDEVAKDLHTLGFNNIYIATGARSLNLEALPWVKGVVGKSPPWI